MDVGVFFTAFYFGSREGAVVGGLAGFLIDLISGYPQWMFFSLLNHGFQGYFAGFKGKWQWLGLVLATIFMVAGSGIGLDEWLGSSHTRNHPKSLAKYRWNDFRISSLS